MKLFAQIRKVDEAKRTVVGRAVQEVVDHSGEMIDYLASKPYFEKWSAEVAKDSDGKSLGNVRAMHQAIAVGKVTGIDFVDGEKAIDIVVKVVDDNEWKKVLEGVYTGFSIGGKYVEGSRQVVKVAGRDVTRYTAAPNEVSLVDRPCIPTAKFFEVHKADGALAKVDFKSQPEPEVLDATVNGTPEEVDALVKLMAEKGLSMSDLLTGLAKGFPPSDKEDDDEDMEDEKDADGKPTGKKVPKKKAADKVDVAALRKNFYDCPTFSSVLTSLISLKNSKAYEAFASGEGTQVPAQIASAIAIVGKVFKACIDDAVAQATKDGGQNQAYVALAEQAGELAKLPESVTKVAEDPVLALATLTKVLPTATETPPAAKTAEQLAQEQSDAVQKVVAASLEPLQKALAAATAEIAELKKAPAVPRVAIRAVAKTADTVPGIVDQALEKLVQPIPDGRGGVNAVAGLIKGVHAMGGTQIKT